MSTRLGGAVLALVLLTVGPSGRSPRQHDDVAPPRICVPDAGYLPPTSAAPLDPFRPPATPYGPGNRGIEYATVVGDDVRAIGAGVVSFAGRIGSSNYVTVAHADGLRSSYSYLGAVLVTEGARVATGEMVGRAEGPFQLGVRCGTDYLDPASLFGDRAVRWRARLVADDRFPSG